MTGTDGKTRLVRPCSDLRHLAGIVDQWLILTSRIADRYWNLAIDCRSSWSSRAHNTTFDCIHIKGAMIWIFRCHLFMLNKTRPHLHWYILVAHRCVTIASITTVEQLEIQMFFCLLLFCFIRQWFQIDECVLREKAGPCKHGIFICRQQAVVVLSSLTPLFKCRHYWVPPPPERTAS